MLYQSITTSSRDFITVFSTSPTNFFLKINFHWNCTSNATNNSQHSIPPLLASHLSLIIFYSLTLQNTWYSDVMSPVWYQPANQNRVAVVSSTLNSVRSPLNPHTRFINTKQHTLASPSSISIYFWIWARVRSSFIYLLHSQNEVQFQWFQVHHGGSCGD